MLATLLLIAGEEDREKVLFLYENFHNEMMILAKSRLKAAKRQNYQTEAEDVVQNTFLRLIRYLNKIDFSRPEKALRAYVLTATANEVATLLSEQTETPMMTEALDLSWEETFYESLRLAECKDQIADALKRLDPRLAIVLVLYFLEDRSVSEIAEFLKISPKTVYYRLMRAKEALAESIKEVP